MGLQSNLFHPNHAAPLTSTPSSSALRPSHRTVSLQMDAPNRSLLSQVQAAAHMQAGSSRRPALKQLTALQLAHLRLITKLPLCFICGGLGSRTPNLQRYKGKSRAVCAEMLQSWLASVSPVSSSVSPVSFHG